MPNTMSKHVLQELKWDARTPQSKRVNADTWETHKEEILSIYEQATLLDMMRRMEERHPDFRPSYVEGRLLH